MLLFKESNREHTLLLNKQLNLTSLAFLYVPLMLITELSLYTFPSSLPNIVRTRNVTVVIHCCVISDETIADEQYEMTI